jgi:uncharacterized membrane protein
MNTPASFRNHPIHPMLIVFPIGLWIFSLVCDIMYYAGPHNLFWKAVAFYSMAGGVIGALLAAIPGFIDYLSLRDRRRNQVATTHMVLNLIVVAMFIFNLGVRYNTRLDDGGLGLVLSLIAVGFLGVSGWLGGMLVYELHVGVSAPAEQSEIERRVA